MTDKEILDGLQSLLAESKSRVIMRDSETGRGWRLHQTNRPLAYNDVRMAIMSYLSRKKQLP